MTDPFETFMDSNGFEIVRSPWWVLLLAYLFGKRTIGTKDGWRYSVREWHGIYYIVYLKKARPA